MTKIRMLALMAVAALLLIFPAVAMGQQIPPHLSAVTANVDGAPASNGTVVTAWIDGSEVGSGEVTGGVAILIISGDASFTGKTISFKIGDLDAKETDTWEQGGHVNPEITISASSAMEPTVAPTAMMVATAAPVKGDKGDKGDTGSAGATGPAGAAGGSGAQGGAGPAGADGSAGSAGPAGPAGQAGPAGVAGEAGGGGGGAIGVIALILAIVAIVAAGGAFVIGRRTA